jgi:ornithine carbamoyltransferase
MSPLSKSSTKSKLNLKGRDLLSIEDLSRAEAEEILSLAAKLKKTPRTYATALSGQVMAMLFEKPSLRTRVTFESGMFSLGGLAIYLSQDQVGMGNREADCDVARNLARWVQVIVARTFSHQTLIELAQEANIPVINALSDWEHPCQALADFQTIRETFGKERIVLTFIGDGNNVCHSLMLLAGLLGYPLRVACPAGYEPAPHIQQKTLELVKESGGSIVIGNDPCEMAREAQILYTDAWTSMGQEKEKDQRLHDFQGYQVNRELLSLAAPNARIMHCLPAHRGEEITSEMMDSPQGIHYDQAENRLHAQKALLLKILGGLDD